MRAQFTRLAIAVSSAILFVHEASAVAAVVAGPPDSSAGPIKQLSQEIPRFKTEPSFRHTYFNIENITDDRSLLAPGFIFLDPVHGGPALGVGVPTGEQYGPQIRELDGTLVWFGGNIESYGWGTRRRSRLQDFHVCNYLGTKQRHLCWSEKASGEQRKHVVLDESYSVAAELFTAMVDGSTNLHEFNIVGDGYSYVQAVWPIRSMDLSTFGGPRKGRITDGCIQEIRLPTHTSSFEWCWIGSLPVWETTLFPSSGPNITNLTSPKVGSGASGSSSEAWDAWHFNAVDKNEENYYLVSSRHADQILMIAGPDNSKGMPPGTILWRLGGPGGNVSISGEPFRFTKQHNVRFISTLYSEVVISILDNAWEGALKPSDTSSSGMIISVNNETMSARLLRRYRSPSADLSPSQGNLDILANNNVFISWGATARFTEYSYDGQVLYHANFTNETTTHDPNLFTFSYRVFKSPWIGKPTWKPKLVAYLATCSPSSVSPLIIWVSWNGATEVGSWRITVASDVRGPWLFAGTFPKVGFETRVILNENFYTQSFASYVFPRYVAVEALDASGNILVNGMRISELFVPNDRVRKLCDADGCHDPAAGELTGFDYWDSTLSKAGYCSSMSYKLLPQLLVLVFLTIVMEFIDYSYIVLSIRL